MRTAARVRVAASAVDVHEREAQRETERQERDERERESERGTRHEDDPAGKEQGDRKEEHPEDDQPAFHGGRPTGEDGKNFLIGSGAMGER